MTKGGWPPGESESGVGTARMPAGLARGARGSAPTGARGRCSAWTGTASAPVRRSRSRSWPRRPFPLRILVIAAVFVRLASAGPSPRQFSSQSRRFLPRRSLGQLGSYENCHDRERRPVPDLSSTNGLHLMTKDASIVTVCSHKPRDAPRDTPGSGGTGPRGQGPLASRLWNACGSVRPCARRPRGQGSLSSRPKNTSGCVHGTGARVSSFRAWSRDSVVSVG